jgi:predicted ATPase
VERYLAIEFKEHRFPSEFAALIHHKTEGNPLFMADLLRDLRDRGVLAEDGGRWVLTRSLDEVERGLPESVRSMIARKIGRLTDDDRKLALAASVQGHEFDSAVVSEALGVDPGEVEERLEALDRVHVFVRAVGEHEFPDRTLTLRYRFVHVLYQNALYASLQPTRRASLSGKVAAALARHHGPTAPAVSAQLAVLYEAARDFPKAAAQFVAAAQHAAELFAFREAAALSKRGLQALDGLAEDPVRIQQELGLQLILGLSRSFRLGGTGGREATRAPARCAASSAIHRSCFRALGPDPGAGHSRRSRFSARLRAAARSGRSGRNDHVQVAGHQMMASVCEFLGETTSPASTSRRPWSCTIPPSMCYSANFGLDPA